MCADAPRGPAPPGSGLQDTPAPCRGSLAQGHTGGPAWEGPARLSVPSGMRSPGAWAGACSPHLHVVRTAPQGMWTWTLQGWSGPWVGSRAAGPSRRLHAGDTSSPSWTERLLTCGSLTALETTSSRNPRSDLWERGCHGSGRSLSPTRASAAPVWLPPSRRAVTPPQGSRRAGRLETMWRVSFLDKPPRSQTSA